MTLAEYKKESGMTYRALAKELGVPYSTVYRVAIGEREPSMRLAYTIVLGTHGKVDPWTMITEKNFDKINSIQR